MSKVPNAVRRRLAPETFALPVDKMRSGYYSDAYFTFSREVLEFDGHRPRVLMQVFQRDDSVLGGIDEALAILRLCSGREADGRWITGWDDLNVRALFDGDLIEPWEPVLEIAGDYSLFCHLETLYLGVLARRTLISRNVRDVVEAAGGKPIMYFPARFDHWHVQTGDGWAAHIAGAIGVSTDAQASWWGGKGIGTVPHGLIAAYGGDTVLAAVKFADRFADELHVTVLVDFENDSVRTALEVADALGDRLWAVRVDTSETMVDRSLWHEMGRFRPTGVVPELVAKVRRALDNAGHERVRIVASGGFDPARIRAFERASVPVDAYGVGSSLLRGANDFTADVVRVDGRPCAKVGREERPAPRLSPVTWDTSAPDAIA
jgi:nicotinate phosphoribosyltransferase